MPKAEFSSPTAPRPFVRMGWLVALASVAVVAVAFTFYAGADSPAPQSGKGANAGAEVSSEELANLKQAVTLLERKSVALERKSVALAQQSSALEHKSSFLEAAVTDGTGTEEIEPADTRTDLEIHQAELTELDVLLTTDEGDVHDRRSAAESFERELGAAITEHARVVEVHCATALCKAVIEEDTSVHPEMDTSILIDNTPSLKREAMFGYETDGPVKRTTIYAAREGQSFAAARGLVPPSDAP